ncbi:MAG TPA: hypothetical protein VII72_09810 [Myxococcota bacterium]
MPRSILALVTLLLCLGGAVRAEPRPAPAALDTLIQRSGLDDQLAQFEGAMQRGITQVHEREPSLREGDLARMRKAVADAYAPSRLRPALRAELAKSISRAEIAAALAWVDSPAGRRLEALEKKASTPEGLSRLEAAARRGAPPLAAARAQTLHALVKATRADEVAATILIETAVGIQEGFASNGPDTSQATVAQMRKGLESEREKLSASLHEQSFIAFALVYQGASDADLAALLGFARSPAGVRYYAVTSRAFATTLGQAAKRAGSALVVPAAPADI